MMLAWFKNVNRRITSLKVLHWEFHYYLCELARLYSSIPFVVWTKAWEIEVLNTNNPRYVKKVTITISQEEEWDQLGGCANSLAICSKLGDNFVVNALEDNDGGVDFYVVLCIQQTHIPQTDLKCHWGSQFHASDVVIYYWKWGTRESNYVILQRSHAIYLDVSHVWGTLFFMFPSNHRLSRDDPLYTLLEHAVANITAASLNKDFE